MKKVLLIGINFASRIDEAAKALAPYYLKSYCDSRIPDGASSIYIKQFLLSTADARIIQEVVSLKPDVIGFSVYLWNIDKIINLSRLLKKYMPLVQIVLGGPEVYPLAEEVLKNNDFVDLIVRDEGEVTFYELMRCNFEEDNFKNILGITFRKNGSAISNPARPLVNNLDEIPSPFLNGIFEFEEDYSVVHFGTSRGCIFSCRFCCWTSKGIREYSLSRIFQELDIILNNKAVKGMCFCDSNIFFNKPRAKKIFNFLIENNKRKVPIFFELNAEFLDDELIAMIRALKTNVFSFGLQTINEDALRAINRSFNQQKFEDNVRKLRNKAKKSHIYFDLIYGLPADTLIGFKRSINYVLSYKPDSITFFPLLALPGSDFFINPQKYGLELLPGAPHRVVATDKFSQKDMLEAKKIGLFITIILRYRLLREYFYFLSIYIYRKKNQNFYLEPILRFIEFIETKTNILNAIIYSDLSPPSEKDSEGLSLLRKKLKADKFKLMKGLFIFSIREFLYFLKRHEKF